MEQYFSQSLMRGDAAAWLPDGGLTQWALKIAWAVVLAACVMRLCQLKWPRRRIHLAALAAVWVMLPGSASPSYWLALAFQMPSLMSVLLCGVWIVQMTTGHRSDRKSSSKLRFGYVAVGLGVALGWVLLADMLAWWPWSIYAWGFGTPALALVCAATVLLWLAAGSDSTGQRTTLYMAGVIAVYTLTRLPSGNLWDALLDPWLWLVLQVEGLRFLWNLRQQH